MEVADPITIPSKDSTWLKIQHPLLNKRYGMVPEVKFRSKRELDLIYPDRRTDSKVVK